jgi:hypothetical protein
MKVVPSPIGDLLLVGNGRAVTELALPGAWSAPTSPRTTYWTRPRDNSMRTLPRCAFDLLLDTRTVPAVRSGRRCARRYGTTTSLAHSRPRWAAHRGARRRCGNERAPARHVIPYRVSAGGQPGLYAAARTRWLSILESSWVILRRGTPSTYRRGS